MDIFTLWTQSLNSFLKGYCKQVGKHCTQRISCLSLSSLVGSRPHVVQRLVSLIFQMRPRARVGLKSKRKIANSFQARSSAARGDHLLMILESGMILRDVAGSSSETAGLCISSNKVCKVPRQFLHSISHAKGKGRRGEEAPCCFKAGKEANWSTILRMCVPRLHCFGRLLVLSCRWRALSLKPQTLAHLLHIQQRRKQNK